MLQIWQRPARLSVPAEGAAPGRQVLQPPEQTVAPAEPPVYLPDRTAVELFICGLLEAEAAAAVTRPVQLAAAEAAAEAVVPQVQLLQIPAIPELAGAARPAGRLIQALPAEPELAVARQLLLPQAPVTPVERRNTAARAAVVPPAATRHLEAAAARYSAREAAASAAS